MFDLSKIDYKSLEGCEALLRDGSRVTLGRWDGVKHMPYYVSCQLASLQTESIRDNPHAIIAYLKDGVCYMDPDYDWTGWVVQSNRGKFVASRPVDVGSDMCLKYGTDWFIVLQPANKFYNHATALPTKPNHVNQENKENQTMPKTPKTITIDQVTAWLCDPDNGLCSEADQYKAKCFEKLRLLWPTEWVSCYSVTDVYRVLSYENIQKLSIPEHHKREVIQHFGLAPEKLVAVPGRRYRFRSGDVYIATKSNTFKCPDGTPILVHLETGCVWSTRTSFDGQEHKFEELR